jgi:hypothetical protein
LKLLDSTSGRRLIRLSFDDEHAIVSGGFDFALGDLDGNGAAVDHWLGVAEKQHLVLGGMIVRETLTQGFAPMCVLCHGCSDCLGCYRCAFLLD